MKPLAIQHTEHTPSIYFDKENGRFEITGRSFVDDPQSFYASVLAWLQDYAKYPNASTEMVIALEFYNTETGKYLYDLLSILERIKGAKVTWLYAEQDRDMEESGLDYAELVNIPFEFKMH